MIAHADVGYIVRLTPRVGLVSISGALCLAAVVAPAGLGDFSYQDECENLLLALEISTSRHMTYRSGYRASATQEGLTEVRPLID